MITRFVPSCPGPGASDLDDAGSHATRSVHAVTTTAAAAAAVASASTPEDILRQAHAMSLAGIFNQIAAIAEHSFEIFNELKDEGARLGERFQRIQTRVSTIAQIVAIANDSEQRNHLIVTKLPTREECGAVLAIPEFSFSRTVRHSALAKAYAKCEPMPALELFDEFCQPPQPATDKPGSLPPPSSSSSSSRKKYSNPGFFMDEWMKKETSRHQRALQAKEERRRERRELKRGVKSLSLPQQQQKQQSLVREDQSETSNNNNSTPTGSENEPHKSHHHHHHSSSGSNKFLKIRSWREIYGTGEGKELARQQKQQQKQHDGSVASPATGEVATGGMLDGKKKSSRKSMTAAAAACNDEGAESPALPPMSVAQPLSPPSSPLPLAYTDPEGNVHQPEQLHFSYVPSIYAPPPPPPPVSAACSGAFMQEIDDDDELFFDFADEPEVRVSTENSNNHNNTTPDSEEFVDHGLSYYYDPASTIHQLVPPPPPPPPLPLPIGPVSNDGNEPAFSDVLVDSDCLDEQDDFVPPPPPPPPPPPSSATESLSIVSDPGYTNTPIPSRSLSCLLQEIQLGTPLRHIKIDEGEEGEEIEGDESVDGPGNSRPKTERREPANSEAPASQLTLLEQIKMQPTYRPFILSLIQQKQRNLRPVEPLAPRRPFQISKSAAPFADSIARILERRSLIAYDSDSSNSDASDNEW